MKCLIALILLSVFIISPVFAEESKNPSLIIDIIEVPSYEFNKILRDADIIQMERTHAISWQVTIDNNLLYVNPNGNAVLRIYDKDNPEKLVEIGMGAKPDEKFWIAVQTPKEGYVVVHSDLERGWSPASKAIVSYTERAGLTVNNGARIVVSNLDIGIFAIDSYSVYGMESSTDPPAVNSGSMILEFISGDPAKNPLALFPFYIAAGVGIIVGVLYLTKKRS
ncbi:MAG: hypothetical protein COY74_02405 [Nitrosopumilales archaeon CG_4_10_14_0_8_um_filter_34_8]|nr:MAG: hypothetical protein COY74_02405 [Nitrosopumilales archaeon CG_4_10_14_0_8_um_filter_34_8]PJB97735.1 MAG: hypothetical protein CO079_05940 [Nitrosopumilales archaeon CG_4_9_14_0_8_um_filter_34_10]